MISRLKQTGNFELSNHYVLKGWIAICREEPSDLSSCFQQVTSGEQVNMYMIQ